MTKLKRRSTAPMYVYVREMRGRGYVTTFGFLPYSRRPNGVPSLPVIGHTGAVKK